MTKTTTETTTTSAATKPRKRAPKKAPAVHKENHVVVDPEASGDEAMVLDNAPFTDSLKRIGEQAREWEETALSPRGTKPYELAAQGRSGSNFNSARVALVICIAMFAVMVAQTIYFSSQILRMNSAIGLLKADYNSLTQDVATLSVIKLPPLDQPTTAPVKAVESKVEPVAAKEAPKPAVPIAKAQAAAPKVQPHSAQTPPKAKQAKPAIGNSPSKPVVARTGDFD